MNALKEIREYRNLLQKELASEIKVSPPQLSKYEHAKTEMPASVLIACAMALNVSTDELLGLKPISFDNLENLDEVMLREESEYSYNLTATSHLNALMKDLKTIEEASEKYQKELEDLEQFLNLHIHQVKHWASYCSGLLGTFERIQHYEQAFASTSPNSKQTDTEENTNPFEQKDE